MTKRCTVCGLIRAITFFGKRKQSGSYQYRSECNECRADKQKKRNQLMSLKQKSVIRDRFLTKTYGISLDIYNDMFTKQSGKCLGCEIHQSLLPKSLCVDHCHKSGKVRGLLCSNCNNAIGYVKENPNTLESLIKYLGVTN